MYLALSMHIVQTNNNQKIDAEILPINQHDYANLKAEEYYFDWSEEKAFHVYKLTIKGQDEILGLVSLDFIDSESRIEIRLLATSKVNRGRQKKYDRIAGGLIAFAARMSIRMYATFPCISLEPKTELRDHYKKAYYMKDGGRSVFTDGIDLVKLSVEYE